MSALSSKNARTNADKETRVARAVGALEMALVDYEAEHPHWRIEVLISLIRWSVRSLQHYIEDRRDREITWEQPFVELQYPIEWDWPASRMQGDEHGRILYGSIDEANVAGRRLAVKTLSQIMTRAMNACTLGDMTNWARFSKRGDHYTPYLPLELAEELNAIKGKRARRQVFEELTRPFSIGAGLVDFETMELRENESVSPQVAAQLAELPNAIDFPAIGFSGEVNGRRFDLSLVFLIHPLITDQVEEKAYHPITVGLQFEPEIVENKVILENPAEWSRKDRAKFWKELLEALDKLTDELIPKEESEESVIITVNAQLKVPVSRWKPENRGSTMKMVTDALSAGGEVTGIQMRTEGAGDQMRSDHCPVCGCTHDRSFTQVVVSGHEPITIAGVLPDILRCVHAAHEKGLPRLSTKDDELLRLCGGYSHPSKAFYDLGQREAYKIIFDTSRRGFIAMRQFIARS